MDGSTTSKKDYKLKSFDTCSKLLISVLKINDKTRRSLELVSAADLKSMAKEKGIPITNKKKAELITELAKPDSVRQQEKAEKEAVKDAAKVKNKNPTKPKKFSIGDLDPTVLPTGILLKQSYLRPQTRGPRLAAKIGHRNEEPFLTSFFRLSQKPNDDGDEYSFSAISPVTIYRVGLMRKKGASKFAKASLDAVTFIKRNNDDANSALELVPTEVKSRVSPSTWSEASDRIEDIMVQNSTVQDGSILFLFRPVMAFSVLSFMIRRTNSGRRMKHFNSSMVYLYRMLNRVYCLLDPAMS